MKIVFTILLIVFTCNMGTAMSLTKSQNPFEGNLEYVTESQIGGIDMISDTIISFEHNKVKAQYTTFSGDIPAFDVVLDFNEGLAYKYFNLTGKWVVSKAPKLNLAEYYEMILMNHTEFAGYRGEHLEVYEIKHPEEEGARTWLYGMQVDQGNGKVFLPTRFQTHYPSETEEHNYVGELLDTMSTPSISEEAFEYLACKEVSDSILESTSHVGLLGVSHLFLAETLKN